MNRKQFQEWLNNFPEDTTIECVLAKCDSIYTVAESEFRVSGDHMDLNLAETFFVDGEMFYYDSFLDGTNKTLIIGKKD